MDRKEPVPYYGGVRIIEIEIIRILVSLRPDKVSIYRGILITNNFQCFCSFSKVHIQLRPISNDLANYLHRTPGHVYLRPNHLQKLLNNRNRRRGLRVCQPGSLLSQFQPPWQSYSFLCFYCTAGIIAIQAHLNPVKTARIRCENQEWSPLDNKMPGYIINQRFSCTSLLRNRQLQRAQCLFSSQLLAPEVTVNVAFGFIRKTSWTFFRTATPAQFLEKNTLRSSLSVEHRQEFIFQDKTLRISYVYQRERNSPRAPTHVKQMSSWSMVEPD